MLMVHCHKIRDKQKNIKVAPNAMYMYMYCIVVLVSSCFVGNPVAKYD